MGKKKSPGLPATPAYQEDPRFREGLDRLFGLGERLTSFDFTGDLSPLAETISTSPEMTKLFLTGLKAQLDPIMRDVRKQTINQLAASNQLESSVTANRLAELEGDIAKNYITQTTEFGIADIDRALRNRIELFGTGLDVTGQATGMAGTAQQQKNVFNLESYENQVAAMLYGKDDKGGWSGALAGGLGGAATGAAVGSLVPGVGTGVGALAGGLIGGAAGYFMPSSTGRGLATSGAGALAMSPTFRYTPGSTKGAGETFRSGGNILDELEFGQGLEYGNERLW